ncbi:Gustatory receptor, partial [Aphis craccivora]
MTIFKITLKPILIFNQLLGLINISYTLEPTTGLLLQNTRSTIIYPLLELARTCVMIIYFYCTITLTERSDQCTDFTILCGFFLYLHMCTQVHIEIMLRFSTSAAFPVQKLINGIIEFDQKTAVLSTDFSIQQRSLSKRFLNSIYISLLIYFIGFELYQVYLWPPKNHKYLYNYTLFI